MAGNSGGKWVSRAAATGGGRTYRGQAPINWYAALVIIVLLGVLSVVYSNYEYRNPSSAATSTTLPTTRTTWYAGIDFDICGKVQPSLAADITTATATKASFYTTGNGVITISPKSASDAGKDAVLGKFVAAYKGLVLTATQLKLPIGKSPVLHKNGQSCPKGTKYAGKPSQVQVTYWSNALTSKAKPVTYQGDPSTLRFSANQLITVGFVPPGTKLPKPNGTIVTALLEATSGAAAATTTTTAPGTTTTTAPGTTTTAPATTTTAPATTKSTSSSRKK